MEIGTEIVKPNWKFRILSATLTGALYLGMMYLMDFEIDSRFQNHTSYIIQALIFATFSELNFPFGSQKILKKIASNLYKSIIPELSQEEHIEIEGIANLFHGIEAVGGKLFLTNKKLIFKSHKINIQKGQTDIDYKTITEITKRKTAKIANNGIKIKTINGNKFNFVVNDREQWIEKINKKITQHAV